MFTSQVPGLTLFSPGDRHPGQRDSQESSARQCALAVVRLSLLLLHPGLLHVAGSLPQQEGEATILNSPVQSQITFTFPPQTRHQLEKQLDWENCHLYSKLGLRWKLARQRCDSSLMMEHVMSPLLYSHNIIWTFCFQVLLIEFVPKQNLFKPD